MIDGTTVIYTASSTCNVDLAHSNVKDAPPSELISDSRLAAGSADLPLVFMSYRPKGSRACRGGWTYSSPVAPTQDDDDDRSRRRDDDGDDRLPPRTDDDDGDVTDPTRGGRDENIDDASSTAHSGIESESESESESGTQDRSPRELEVVTYCGQAMILDRVCATVVANPDMPVLLDPSDHGYGCAVWGAEEQEVLGGPHPPAAFSPRDRTDTTIPMYLGGYRILPMEQGTRTPSGAEIRKVLSAVLVTTREARSPWVAAMRMTGGKPGSFGTDEEPDHVQNKRSGHLLLGFGIFSLVLFCCSVASFLGLAGAFN